MDAKKEKAFIQFVQDNRVSMYELFGFLNEPKPGYFHFTDGSYFPELIPGLIVDGVYIADGYCASKFEREKGKTTMGRAKRFCANRDVSLPPSGVRDVMFRNVHQLNAAFDKIGWPRLQEYKHYWADGDCAGDGTGPEIIYIGGAPGDDMILPGSYEAYEYYVRGVFQVYHVIPKLKIDEKAELPQNERQAFPAFVKALGLSMTEFSDYISGKMKLPKAGDYLLKNGSFSTETVYDQEWGIYLNENVYLGLSGMLKEPLTLQEAQVVCCANDFLMPSKEQLELFETHLLQVNVALAKIGMGMYSVPADVLQNCWYRELLNDSSGMANPSERRRLLMFGEKANITENYLILKKVMKQMDIVL